MATAQPRSSNAELAEGLTDGKYKKVIANRGGVVEGTGIDSKASLSDTYFGIHEQPVKVTPDGLHTRTPYFVQTAAAHLG